MLDIVLGEPLTSGDSMSFQLKSDEDTAAAPTTAYPLSYSLHGGILRKQIRVTDFLASQLSTLINFLAGAGKIKTIDVWGDEIPLPQI